MIIQVRLITGEVIEKGGVYQTGYRVRSYVRVSVLWLVFGFLFFEILGFGGKVFVGEFILK